MSRHISRKEKWDFEMERQLLIRRLLAKINETKLEHLSMSRLKEIWEMIRGSDS